MISPWLRRLASRWEPLGGLAVPPETITADERARYRAYAGAVMSENLVKAGAAIVAIALIWWPLDPIVFAGRPQVIRDFAWFRGLVVATMGALYLVARPLGWLAARPVAVIGAALVLELAVSGWSMGRVGGVEGPWFQFLYVAPFFTVAVLAPLGVRAAILALAMGGMVAAFLAAAPDQAHHPAFAPAVSYLVFVCVMALWIGHAGYLLTLATFVHRDRTSAAAREVRRLNDGLASRVAEQTRELRALANHAETLREEERRWMAREIHDELGQELMALRYAVRLARAQPGAGSAGPALGEVERLLARADQTMRRILRALRPRVLDELGLASALCWLGRETGERTALACTVSVSPDELPVAPAVALATFRIAQEALTNVVRHAGASRAELTVRLEGDVLHLEVVDDGVGLADATPESPDGLGRIGIRERAAALGGRAVWSSPERGGTTLAVTLPLAPPEPT